MYNNELYTDITTLTIYPLLSSNLVAIFGIKILKRIVQTYGLVFPAVSCAMVENMLVHRHVNWIWFRDRHWKMFLYCHWVWFLDDVRHLQRKVGIKNYNMQ